MRDVKVGLELRWERLVTEEDILRFMEVSGDRGVHHRERDGKGRLLAHGLLTATLPTKLGGDLDYVARTMEFEFLKPVYAGDRLACVGLVEKAESGRAFTRVAFSFQVVNQDGVLVMRGNSAGVIPVR